MKGIELVKFTHSSPELGIFGYNGAGYLLTNAEEPPEEDEFDTFDLTLGPNEVIKEIKYIKEDNIIKAL